MSSILLSFVGNQDPFAKNHTEGSIVTLIKHLQQECCVIQHVVLLHTQTIHQNAIDVKDWLTAEVKEIDPDRIQIQPVDEALSLDPIDQVLAVQAARQAIERVQALQTAEDRLELNASSGTPAMKSAWGILQAAGYMPRSRVWQVRNPEESRSGQDRVFQSNVDTLKNEFDRRVIQNQIHNYNYSGALESLKASTFKTPVLLALLTYGHCRLSLDFDRACEQLQPYASQYPQLIQEIRLLSPQKLEERLRKLSRDAMQARRELKEANSRALLIEAYFKARTRQHRQEYSDFLVDVFRLLEAIPKFLVQYQIGLEVPCGNADFGFCWQRIRQFQQGQLYQYLQTYRFANNRGLELEGFMSRYLLMAILEFDPQYGDILPCLKRLNEYCDQRNDYVHGFRGISGIENEHQLIADLRKVLLKGVQIPAESPFDRLNQILVALLDG